MASEKLIRRVENIAIRLIKAYESGDEDLEEVVAEHLNTVTINMDGTLNDYELLFTSGQPHVVVNYKGVRGYWYEEDYFYPLPLDVSNAIWDIVDAYFKAVFSQKSND